MYKGSFNTIVVIASIAMRLVAGRLPTNTDVLNAAGRRRASRAGHVVVFRVDFGACAGGGRDCLRHVRGHQHAGDFCWTVDLAPEGKAATALGTMLMALEVGIGVGAFASGSWYASDPFCVVVVVPRMRVVWRGGWASCCGGCAFTKQNATTVENSAAQEVGTGFQNLP